MLIQENYAWWAYVMCASTLISIVAWCLGKCQAIGWIVIWLFNGIIELISIWGKIC